MDAQFFDPHRTEDDFKIRIDRDGQWFHEGQNITRDQLVKLFATALHYDSQNNDYWLITPHEQGRVEVEDVPYIITDFEWSGGDLTCTTNLGHIIKPDAHNPIYIQNNLPYCIIRNHVPARINRQVREKLIDIALSQNGYNEAEKILYLKANGHDHPLAHS